MRYAYTTIIKKHTKTKGHTPQTITHGFDFTNDLKMSITSLAAKIKLSPASKLY